MQNAECKMQNYLWLLAILALFQRKKRGFSLAFHSLFNPRFDYRDIVNTIRHKTDNHAKTDGCLPLWIPQKYQLKLTRNKCQYCTNYPRYQLFKPRKFYAEYPAYKPRNYNGQNSAKWQHPQKIAAKKPQNIHLILQSIFCRVQILYQL